MEYITLDHTICQWKPTITGTRITVEFILDQIAAWRSLEWFVQQYDLTLDQVHHAIKFAARNLYYAKTPEYA